jgi:uncharacterized membrane protein
MTFRPVSFAFGCKPLYNAHMRKITLLFFGFLFALFSVWLGDTIDKSENTPKNHNDEMIDKTIETVKTSDYYISIAEVITAGGALITGIISFATRNIE